MYPLVKFNKSFFVRNSFLVRQSNCCRCGSFEQFHTHTSYLEQHFKFHHYQANALLKRNLHATSRLRYDEPLKPSSKIEETVQALKAKEKEKQQKSPIKSEDKTVATPASTASSLHPVPASLLKDETSVGVQAEVKPVPEVVKKSLGQRIWAEVLHYYHGFRLLGLDIKLSALLVWRILNGKQLTRRESNLLIRTVGDIFRLIPFSVFIIVPFMELLLPVFIKLFPGMLPSQFATNKEKEDKMKQSLKVKLEMAKFLQKTLDNMGVAGKGRSSESAKEFAEFYEKVRSHGLDTSTEDIMKFSRLFQDEITLDSLSRPQLQALCRVLELHPIGTSNFLRFQLRLKLRSLAADDKMIQREGVGLLTLEELQNACRARGMRAYGVSKERLQTQLKQWLDLSLNEKVPPSLLLLSRAFMLPETIATTEILKATISELPETVAVSTKAAIDELEGKVDNKTKILVLKEEERKIKEEKAEYLEEKKRKEEEKKKKELESGEQDPEILTDKAEVIIDKAKLYESHVMSSVKEDIVNLVKEKQAKEEDIVAAEDLQVVEDALDAIGKKKKELLVEKHELADLREEMSDYQEDLKDLEEVVQSLDSSSKEAKMLKESKAAKRLFKSVNKMINNMDKVIEDLSQKEKAIKKDISAAQVTPEVKTEQSAELVKIDELIGTLRKIQQVPDTSKLQRIAEVLDKMDADHDGAIRVEAVLKVLELIGEENVNLSKKQFEEIVEMINKEEEIEMEEQLDKELKSRLKTSTAEIPAPTFSESNLGDIPSSSKSSVAGGVSSLESSLPPPTATSDLTRKQKNASEKKIL